MSQKALSEYLVDNITNVTFANGVFASRCLRLARGMRLIPSSGCSFPPTSFHRSSTASPAAGCNIATQLQEREGGVEVREALDDGEVETS
jgi:hypothetical protein